MAVLEFLFSVSLLLILSEPEATYSTHCTLF